MRACCSTVRRDEARWHLSARTRERAGAGQHANRSASGICTQFDHAPAVALNGAVKDEPRPTVKRFLSSARRLDEPPGPALAGGLWLRWTSARGTGTWL